MLYTRTENEQKFQDSSREHTKWHLRDWRKYDNSLLDTSRERENWPLDTSREHENWPLDTSREHDNWPLDTRHRKVDNWPLDNRRQYKLRLLRSIKHQNNTVTSPKHVHQHEDTQNIRSIYRLFDLQNFTDNMLNIEKNNVQPEHFDIRDEDEKIDHNKKVTMENTKLEIVEKHLHTLLLFVQGKTENKLPKYVNRNEDTRHMRSVHNHSDLENFTNNLFNNEKNNIQLENFNIRDEDEQIDYNKTVIMENTKLKFVEKKLHTLLMFVQRIRENKLTTNEILQSDLKYNSADRNSEKIEETLGQYLSQQRLLYQASYERHNNNSREKANPAMVANTLLEPKINICQFPNIKFMIMVISAAPNWHQRNSIRQTWLMPVKKSQDQQYVFLLGNPDNKKIQKNVEAEHDIHGDIIQGTFSDTYRNLTLKTMLALHWFSTHCPFADFLIKVDDDVYMNSHLTINWLYRLNHTNPHVHQGALIGAVLINNPVVRDPNHRWFVSRDTYSPPTYPKYVSGPAYVISGKVARDVANIMWQIPFIEMEDSFVGLAVGVLPYKVHIMDYVSLYYLWRWKWKTYATDLSNHYPIIFIHKVSPKDQHILWELWNIYMFKTNFI